MSVFFKPACTRNERSKISVFALIKSWASRRETRVRASSRSSSGPRFVQVWKKNLTIIRRTRSVLTVLERTSLYIRYMLQERFLCKEFYFAIRRRNWRTKFEFSSSRFCRASEWTRARTRGKDRREPKGQVSQSWKATGARHKPSWNRKSRFENQTPRVRDQQRRARRNYRKTVKFSGKVASGEITLNPEQVQRECSKKSMVKNTAFLIWY